MASAAWEGRNARARALGYRNYYDYRVHNFGRIPAGESAPTGEERQRLRGHRGAADVESVLRSGDVELVNVIRVDGLDFLLIVTTSDGRTREFRVPEAKVDKVRGVIADLGPDAPQVEGSDASVAAFR